MLAVWLLLVCGSVTYAQTKYSDRCVVGVIDMTSKKLSDLDGDDPPSLKTEELGSFDTVIGEEELTSRAFQLPKSKLFVVASVWYTDESMAGENSQDSLSLQLTISRTPKRDVLTSLQFAEAEVLSLNFQVARVSTMFKEQGRSLYIVMECRKNNRP